MRVKLFTHTDLDGIGCAIVGKVAFKDIDITYCNYDDINNKVKEFIINKEYESFDYVYITDISVNDEVAELIDNTHPDNFTNGFTLNEMFQILDHHQTAEFLNKYYWADVRIEEDGEKTSGARMFFDLLKEDEYLLNSQSYKWDRCNNLFEFVEIVRKYDTWLWKSKYNDEKPKMWNDLLYIMGRDNFIETILYRIVSYPCFDFCDFDLKLLEYKQSEINRYIDEKSKTVIKKDILSYKAGIVFAEQFHSELGNKLSEMNPQLDFIILINPSTSISYRTVKDNINLGKDIASVFGGGGHPKAAGSQLPEGFRDKVIDLIFQ